MMAVVLTGYSTTTKGMVISSQSVNKPIEQNNLPKEGIRKILIELFTLQPLQTSKLTKKNHIPVLMNSRSSSPKEIEDNIRQYYNISPTHPIELLDQGRMSPIDAKTYFNTPSGHLDQPSDSPLCLIAKECPTPSPLSITRSIRSTSSSEEITIPSDI